MFGLFKTKTEKEKLQDLYKHLMKEAYKLQSINRAKSDKKYSDADTVLKRIELLESES